MLVKIISLEGIVYQGEAEAAIVPGKQGQLTILAHHIGLITPLKRGKIRIKEGDDNQRSFKIEQGVLEVGPKGANILMTPSPF